jgi:type VI secretion system protein ImpA
LSQDSPCGDDLEYDPVFAEMERAAQGKPEQQFGETIVPPEEPNWKEVKAKAQDLLGRTKDLRVAVHLSQAALNTEGFPAFCECMALVRGYLNRYWETLYPRLDPDDGLDPTQRVNLLLTLCDQQSTLQYLRRAPLVASRVLGRFGLRDVQIAAGEIPAPPNMETPPTTASIDGAFTEVDLEELKNTAKSVRDAAEHVVAIEADLTERVGSGSSASLEPVVAELKQADAVLTEQLKRRGVFDAPPEGAAAGADGEAAAQALTGEILSREDVIRALDKICDYYSRHEPSSPLPLLLVRAKRLVTLGFLEIIEDVAPDALAQAKTIMGNPPAAES